MNDREILVELLDTAKIKQAFRSSTGTVTGLYHAKAVDSDFVKPLADYLIANSVTVQKHGRWVWDSENECWTCGVCGHSALNSYRGNPVDSNYCPYCGAKMDLEAEI